MATTPKSNPVAALEAENARLTEALAEARSDVKQWQQAYESADRRTIPDKEAHALSDAVKALTSLGESRLSGWQAGGYNYERALRYLAHRFNVRWPDAPPAATIEVAVLGNILDGSILVIDPDAPQIIDVRPPRF